ncbi:MAG: UPF0149 family protein [Gammaproteobacteria bacterium]|nr:UPF0149 family protein [Gammaproteobacteria bacterium]
MNYAELQSRLGTKAEYGPVEHWHGLACGLLCSGRPTSVDLLCRLMSEMIGLERALKHQQEDALEQLLGETSQQLDEGQLTFNLLLPEEDEDLAQRTQALCDWCESFLFGLFAGGLNSEVDIAPDVSEFIADLTEISRAGIEDNSADEDNEFHYHELVEYVRVGVLLINEEINPIGNPQQTEH